MPRVRLTGVARVPLLLARAAEALRIDPGPLLARAGLEEVDLADPDTRVPLEKIEALWHELIERAPGAAIGIELGALVPARELGLVGYTMAYSATLGEALYRAERYSRIITEAVHIQLQPGPTHTRLILDGTPSLDALRHPVDARLAIFMRVAREITGREITTARVCFPYPRPPDIAPYVRLFRCPLEFDEQHAELVFANETLLAPAVAADETLNRYLDRMALETLETLGGDTFLEQVQRTVWRGLSSGTPTLEQTASALGVSSRTLQRRLAELNTSFAAMLESFRRDMARRLLRNQGLAVYEVAFLLGYSEPSTFYRAFRRWHGVSPVEYRRSLGSTSEQG